MSDTQIYHRPKIFWKTTHTYSLLRDANVRLLRCAVRPVLQFPSTESMATSDGGAWWCRAVLGPDFGTEVNLKVSIPV